MEIVLVSSLVIIFSLVVGGAFVGIALWMGFRYKHREDAQRINWEKFARLNDLRLVTFGIFPGIEVVGLYRGYRLKLESSRKSQGKYSEPCTRITLITKIDNLLTASSNIEPLLIHEAVAIVTKGELDDYQAELRANFRVHRIVYEQFSSELDPTRLQFLCDWLVELAEVYPRIIAVGGELIPHLEELYSEMVGLRPIITDLTWNIGRHTKSRIAAQAAQLFCADCLTWCAVHKVFFDWNVTYYYGCRTCKQSQEFFHTDRLIVVLDRQMEDEVRQENRTLWANWFAQQAVFDFHAVEIIKASDEEVERFAVQIGNDTELWRSPRYRQMPCVVHTTCGLSENTLKILRRTFGSVSLQ
jgi:hypothetical protein